MDLERVSDLLFGRYRALSVYWAISQLPKAEFTTGELAALSGIPSAVCSKELSRLVELGCVRSTSRRGDYTRDDSSAFWLAVDLLVARFEAE